MDFIPFEVSSGAEDLIKKVKSQIFHTQPLRYCKKSQI